MVGYSKRTPSFLFKITNHEVRQNMGTLGKCIRKYIERIIGRNILPYLNLYITVCAQISHVESFWLVLSLTYVQFQ